MKSIFHIVMLLALAALLVGTTGEAQAAKKSKAASGYKAVVIKVGKNYVVLDKGSKEKRMTLSIDDESVITVGGQEATIADVKAGQHVLFTINKRENSIKTLDVQDVDPPAETEPPADSPDKKGSKD